MDILETEVCLALASYYDTTLPPPSHPDRKPEIDDPNPEECATKDAPVWVENKRI